LSAAFVIDCSITMTWCFDDEATDVTRAVARRLARESVVVPAHWHLEVANVLAITQRTKRLPAAEAKEFLHRLGRFGVEIDAAFGDRAFTHLLPLCQTHRLTSYDAAYLELAIRLGLPLATLDKDLRKAAKAEGVQLLGT
jgi:predicted nucleic acid-binding protein